MVLRPHSPSTIDEPRISAIFIISFENSPSRKWYPFRYSVVPARQPQNKLKSGPGSVFSACFFPSSSRLRCTSLIGEDEFQQSFQPDSASVFSLRSYVLLTKVLNLVISAICTFVAIVVTVLRLLLRRKSLWLDDVHFFPKKIIGGLTML